MRVRILMLSVDEAPMLERSLPLAMAQEGIEEVVVLDNASVDGTEEVARHHGARYVRLPARASYAAAMNAGLRALGESDAVMLLNADCFLEPGCVKSLAARLGEPRVGSVAPRLLRAAAPGRPLHRLDAAGMVVDRRRKNGLVGFDAPASSYSLASPCFGADGAAALYRRAALKACMLPGGEVLDEDMELWATDADLAWRAQLLGWRSVYEPAARALHVRSYSPATRSGIPEWGRRLQFRNRYLMMAKNETAAGLLRDLPWILLYELMALGHALLRERHLLRGYAEAVRLLPGAMRRRRVVQSRRRVARPPFGLRPSAGGGPAAERSLSGGGSGSRGVSASAPAAARRS